MRAFVSVTLAGAIASVIAGCGLSKAGLAPSDPTDRDSGTNVQQQPVPQPPPGDGGAVGWADAESAGEDAGDAFADAGEDVSASSDDAATPCLTALPAGWSVVAYEQSQDACPSGFGGAHDEYSGAAIAAGACSCTCQITTAPSCTAGMVSTSYGVAASTCPTPGATLSVNGSTCTPLPGPGVLALNFQGQPLAPTGGSCSATPQGNDAAVTKRGVRYCDVLPASAESVCEGTVPSSFAACIVSAGDIACPSGSPFGNKTLVADDETLECSACSTCSVEGTCTDPTVTFYSDAMCTMEVVQLASDGTCVPSNASAKPVAAAEYAAQTNASCQASGSLASVSPQGPRTLCCR